MKVLGINNTGDKSTEYVYFKVLADGNLGHFLVTDNTFDPKGDPSNKLRHLFVFPSYEVKKGDVVVLWTKAGNAKTATAADNKTPQHNFYWKLSEHVWNVKGDTAHLIDVKSISNHTVGEHAG